MCLTFQGTGNSINSEVHLIPTPQSLDLNLVYSFREEGHSIIPGYCRHMNFHLTLTFRLKTTRHVTTLGNRTRRHWTSGTGFLRRSVTVVGLPLGSRKGYPFTSVKRNLRCVGKTLYRVCVERNSGGKSSFG